MARAAAKAIEETVSESVTESVTYIPGPQDPSSVKWCGLVFQANVAKEVTGHPDGSEREKLHYHLIERARENKSFSVGGVRARRDASQLPKTAEQYRAYMVGWLQEPGLEHVDQLIGRFARDRDLQAACEVGADDYTYLATLFMPKLHELSKADELSEGQVAQVWINHGINQLPW